MQNSKIFIADDSQIQLILLEKVLEKEGFCVDAFGSGTNLLEAVFEEVPDLVISDIDMPVLNGFDLIKEIRNLPEGSGIPCFLISSKVDQSIQQKVDSIGADGFIEKPFEYKPLIGYIKEQLKSKLLRK